MSERGEFVGKGCIIAMSALVGALLLSTWHGRVLQSKNEQLELDVKVMYGALNDLLSNDKAKKDIIDMANKSDVDTIIKWMLDNGEATLRHPQVYRPSEGSSDNAER